MKNSAVVFRLLQLGDKLDSKEEGMSGYLAAAVLKEAQGRELQLMIMGQQDPIVRPSPIHATSAHSGPDDWIYKPATRLCIGSIGITAIGSYPEPFFSVIPQSLMF